MYSENIKTEDYIYTISLLLQNTGGRHGRDHMVVGSTTIHYLLNCYDKLLHKDVESGQYFVVLFVCFFDGV
jgi:hypothetical protein